MTTSVAEVAVTLPVPGRYHYLVPASMVARARVGARVLVRFGNQKVTGVVVPPAMKPPVGIKLVELSEVLDDEPALSPELVDLCLWIADYYEAPPGEVMRAALPAGSGVASHRWVALTDAGRAIASGEGAALPPKQQALLAQLAAGEVMAATGQSEPVRRNLEALRERGLVEYVEKRDARVRLKRERVAVVVEGADVEGVREVLRRSPKKLAALEALVGAAGRTMTVAALNKIAASVVPQLVKLGLVTVTDREVALDAAPIGDTMGGGVIPELTGEQALAVAEITAAMGASSAGTTTARATSATDAARVTAATSLDTATSSVALATARMTDATGAVSAGGAASSNTATSSAAPATATATATQATSATNRIDATSLNVASSDAPATTMAPDATGATNRTDATSLDVVASSDRPATATTPDATGATNRTDATLLDVVASSDGPATATAPDATSTKNAAASSKVSSSPSATSTIGATAPNEAAQVETSATFATSPNAVMSSDVPAMAEATDGTPATNATRVGGHVIPAADASGAVGSASGPSPNTAAASASAMEPAAPIVSPAPTFRPFLLHGVTGSGKTEVYLRVIARALEQGKTALVLVPEISLTPQLAARFRARFGDKVAILHSGLKEQARLGEWSRLHRGEATIAVGARSAVFAPLRNIGVIVVDEEHDGSFKQDEGVRYHGRDVALVRAQRAGAVCVLGSATPSLESYAHAERGAYRLLVLTERPTARPMPSVEIVDLRTHMPDGDAFLAAPLRVAIGETLASGDQTILFLNRRGFSTFVLCRACGHAFRCPHCSVSLTYHRHSDRLNCHYCGFWQRVPEVCPGCGAKDTIVRKGLGTEKVADAVAAEFPQARVARLDRDVASGAKIEGVLSRVARREVDVLVGTQMVTKGHDFPGVTLVGVLCADTGLNVPDFRASERTFQLLAQVAGRAGRGDRPGRVIVQTYRPGSHAVTCAAAHDYKTFFEQESGHRGDPELLYPPHGRLIAVRIDGASASDVASNSHKLAQVAEATARRAENAGLVVVRGAVPAPMERIRNRTRWQIWLRGSDRAALRRVARAVLATEVPRTVRVALDVDPISAL